MFILRLRFDPPVATFLTAKTGVAQWFPKCELPAAAPMGAGTFF